WPGAGGIVSVLAAGSAAALLQLAHLGAATPAGVLRVPWFGLPHAVGYYCGAVVLVAAMRVRGFPRAMTIATLPVAALVGLLLLTLPDGRFHVVFLDTPGGGVLLTAPDGARMLVDAGASAPALGTALDTLLPPEAPVLDALLLTGSARGSAGGIAGLGARVPGVVMVAADAPGDVPAGVAAALSRHGSAVQILVAGDVLHWHGLDLKLDSCGTGLAVSVRYGRILSWICDSGAPADPGAVPAGPPAAIDVGDGRVEPDGALAATWVVEHRPGATRGGLSAAALGSRLWRTSRDGPLALSCDATRCSR
ncbi:MAG TPA: hypothetical protein VGR61_00370, partial [Candidatus Dormibacteraeota bacterium]|nr:hypothetical protein [Candidatus Dormibacteraeota bacterium]